MSAEPTTPARVIPLAVTSAFLGVLGLLASVWIPTLALLFGMTGAGLGALALKGAAGRGKAFAIAGVALGVVAIAAAILVVLVASGPSGRTSQMRSGGQVPEQRGAGSKATPVPRELAADPNANLDRSKPRPSGSQDHVFRCDRSVLLGDFNGDGRQDRAWVGRAREGRGFCSSAKDASVLRVDVDEDGRSDLATPLASCDEICVPLGVVNFELDSTSEILVFEGPLAPPVSAIVGIYGFRDGSLVPALFPDGSNRFWLSNSWQELYGAYCGDGWTFTTWRGHTDDGGSLRTVATRTYQFDPGRVAFTLVDAQPPKRANRAPRHTGFDGLCGATFGLG